MKNIFLCLAFGLVFSGCSLLPYKTDFTCPNAIGGTCGNALESYNNSLRDISTNQIDYSEYVGVKQ